jgi:hypothetical protein
MEVFLLLLDKVADFCEAIGVLGSHLATLHPNRIQSRAHYRKYVLMV